MSKRGGEPLEKGENKATRLAACVITHLAGALATITWGEAKAELTPYWPKDDDGNIKPQPKYNPFQPDPAKRVTLGTIAYGWVTWGPRVPYSFNKKTLEAQEPSPWLTDIRDHVYVVTGVKYDSVLINFCTEGAALSAHEDKGPTIDRDVDITSVSFCMCPGYKRRFFIHEEPGPKGKGKKRIPLGHGDILKGPLTTHLHGLEACFARDKGKSRSIVLTFRMMPRALTE